MSTVSLLSLFLLVGTFAVCDLAHADQNIRVDSQVAASPTLVSALHQWANSVTGTTTIRVAQGQYNAIVCTL